MQYVKGGCFTKARHDFRLLEAGETLKSIKQVRRRYKMAVMKDFVRFLLSPHCVSPISWGSKTVRLDLWEHVQLPWLTRRLSATAIVLTYRSREAEWATFKVNPSGTGYSG